jgi:hypothetical protein
MKNFHKEDCQYLYKKLLYNLEKPISKDSASYYLKNLKETEHCDYIKDFSQIRNDVDSYINGLPIIEKERQCVFHYYTWHKKNLLESLSYYNRFQYHYQKCVYKWYQYFK